MGEIIIRDVRLDDAKDLCDIYAYYVQNTAITFEYDIPSVSEFEDRIKKITKKYPYFVAVDDGEIIGYSYAHEYYGRAAYDWCVEMTVYLKSGYMGRGIGSILYNKMEDALKKMNITNLYSCIATTDRESEFLTDASVGFHKAVGYTKIADFKNCGYKFNEWFDMIWMEKIIGKHIKNQPAVIKYTSI